MGDSDEENDKDYEQGLNMTGFLFGNVDENGQLENDILDPTAKRHLASLGQLGLNSLLREMIADDDDGKLSDKEADTEDNDDVKKENNFRDAKDEVDYMAKSPTAEDFSDITELAEDVNENGKFSIFCYV